MRYTTLTTQDMAAIRHSRIAALEAEHYGWTLNLARYEAIAADPSSAEGDVAEALALGEEASRALRVIESAIAADSEA